MRRLVMESLSSSSDCGNCYVIRVEGLPEIRRINNKGMRNCEVGFIDCGLKHSHAQYLRLPDGSDPRDICPDWIALTHSHKDHVRDTPTYVKRFSYHSMVYTGQGVWEADSLSVLRADPFVRKRLFRPGEVICTGELALTPFALPHICFSEGPPRRDVQNVGFQIVVDDSVITFATDLKVLPEEHLVFFRGARVILIECYSEELFKFPPDAERGGRPFNGCANHFSNEEAAELLRWANSDGNCPELQLVVAIHVNRRYNSDEAILQTLKEGWEQGNDNLPLPAVLIAKPDQAMELFSLDLESGRCTTATGPKPAELREVEQAALIG